MEIVDKILDWPVIVQGILGSFLFWIIFTLGQKIIQFSTKKVKKDNEIGNYWIRVARKAYRNEEYEKSNYNFFICIYAALHYFLKFIIVIFISYLIKNLIPVFAYVGYAIGFYFIFRSISYVTHFDNVISKEEKEELRKIPDGEVDKAIEAAKKR